MIYFKVRYTVQSPTASGISTPVKKETARDKLARIDFLGCLLLAGWLGAALIAVSLKTSSTLADAYEWDSPLILGLFGSSAVLFVIFLLVEIYQAKEPVLPVELLKQRTPVSVAINNFTISVLAFGTVSFSREIVPDSSSTLYLCSTPLYV